MNYFGRGLLSNVFIDFDPFASKNLKDLKKLVFVKPEDFVDGLEMDFLSKDGSGQEEGLALNEDWFKMSEECCSDNSSFTI